MAVAAGVNRIIQDEEAAQAPRPHIFSALKMCDLIVMDDNAFLFFLSQARGINLHIHTSGFSFSCSANIGAMQILIIG